MFFFLNSLKINFIEIRDFFLYFVISKFRKVLPIILKMSSKERRIILLNPLAQKSEFKAKVSRSADL